MDRGHIGHGIYISGAENRKRQIYSSGLEPYDDVIKIKPNEANYLRVKVLKLDIIYYVSRTKYGILITYLFYITP